MLDLIALTRRLTQGQPVATMTLATPSRPGPSAAPSAPDVATAPVTSAGGTPVDPYAVAQRVYDLMRRELAAEEARCNGRRR